MGRSTRAQADQNRALIVDAATGLFREKGIDAVSIVEIMEAAGMTQGGFYKHFTSKEALAAEACAEAFNRSTTTWKDLINAVPEPGGTNRLLQLATYYLSEKTPEKTCPMIALGQDAAAHSADKPFSQVYRHGAQQMFETFVKAAPPEPNGPQREELMLLFASMVGANLLKRAVGNEPWIQEMQLALMKKISGE
ncbi:TetR family transcriptional regulator [Sodalis sp. dw_96]|uniref:TetR/AcrR family transcriptional regulator n=1 Tax=Sodalis sp. dw_96 TaxID=2719794 RepID=UPI001BD549BA|nr:TetR family transcriptional regulator [Sodalis sp. dw_96]